MPNSYQRGQEDTKGVKPIQDYVVDMTVISEAEARWYLASCRDRNQPRRIQGWFDHCARIRRELRARAAQSKDREEWRALVP